MKRLFDKDTWQRFWINPKKQNKNYNNYDRSFMGIFIYITLLGSSKGLDNGFERAFQSIASNSIFIWAQYTSLPYAGYKAEEVNLN